jgi:hypothetical protein
MLGAGCRGVGKLCQARGAGLKSPLAQVNVAKVLLLTLVSTCRGGNLFPIPDIHRMLEGIYSRCRASVECWRESIPDTGHPLNVGGDLFPIPGIR